MNVDNQSYPNRYYENQIHLLNIFLIRENNPRRNKNVTRQSPLNLFSETAAAVREILIFSVGLFEPYFRFSFLSSSPS